jgi:clan AA aspartic protease
MTEITGEVTGPHGAANVTFLVDSGAMYTVLPHEVWRALGLDATRRERFALADGTGIERPMSECIITLPEGRTTTPVVLGEPGDVALLGVVTLEELGLVLDPFKRSLYKARNYLLRIA